MVIEGRVAEIFLDPRNAVNRGIGGVALLACAPLLFFAAIGVRIETGGPAFLTESRRTKDGRSFASWRFRTCRGGNRTAFGAFLHRTRLELLPQLVNVVRGDTSIATVLD